MMAAFTWVSDLSLLSAKRVFSNWSITIRPRTQLDE